MSEPGIVLDSRETLRRITEAVRWVERMRITANPLNLLPPPPSMGHSVLSVLVTDTTPSAYGYYWGKVQWKHTDNDSTSWYDALETTYNTADDKKVKVVGLNNESLEAKRYIGYVAGIIGPGNVEDEGHILIVAVAESESGRGTFARLTATDGTDWKFVPLTRNTSGTLVDAGSESATYNARPHTIDGTNFFRPPFVGQRVWMWRSSFDLGGTVPQYEFLPVAPPLVGCGLLFDPVLSKYSVDVLGLLGWGLTFGVSGDCLTFQLDETEFGCGFDVLVGDPIKIKPADLVGLPEVTGLVADGTTPCGIKIDQDCADELAGPLADKITEFAMVGGKIRLTVLRKQWTNCHNAAGILVDQYVSATSTEVFEIDACLPQECCDADPLSVVAAADPTSGTAPLEVEFTATPTGGVSPYTYAWDFDDGETGSGSPVTHTYTEAGTYEAEVTVTDACGRTATDTVTVTVNPADVPVGDCDVPGVITATWNAPGSGCEAYAGSFNLTHDGTNWVGTFAGATWTLVPTNPFSGGLAVWHISGTGGGCTYSGPTACNMTCGPPLSGASTSITVSGCTGPCAVGLLFS